MSSPGARWRLWVLGELRAAHGEAVVKRWTTQHEAWLFAMLAIAPLRAQSRERLAGRLWPDAPPDRQKGLFRTTLSRLKQRLEPPGVPPHSVIVADRQAVRLLPGAVWCDAVEFERLAAIGQADAARALHGGELLPGLEDDDEVMARRAALDGLLAQLPRHAVAPLRETVQRWVPRWDSGFHGREPQLQALRHAVPVQRLVTITGFGGCGKTRLAAELAAGIGGFDFVAFVGLEYCASVAAAEERLGSALEMPAPQPGQSALATVRHRLAARRTLLVLDNFENLAAAGAAHWAAELLETLPSVHLLLTSRSATRLAGEHELRLLPLPTPPAGSTLAAVRANPAVALFAGAAERSRGEFHVHAGNADLLVRLTRAVGGLPLALEMAAPLARPLGGLEPLVKALERLPARLSRRGPAAAREPQRGSLPAVLATSLRLLAAPERALLRALAAFRGSFTAAQAAAVSRLADAAPGLDRLHRHSLVESAGEGRHSLLPIVRELVEGTVPSRMRAGTRHRQHFAAMAESLDAGHANADLADLPNLERAFATTLEAAEPVPAALLQVLAHMLVLSGRRDDALACCDAARAAARDEHGRIEADLAAAWALWRCDRRAEAQIEGVQALFTRAQGGAPPRAQARAARLLGILTMAHHGDAEAAHRLLDEAESLLRAAGEDAGYFGVLSDRTGLLAQAGQHDEARALAEATLLEAGDRVPAETRVLLENRIALGWEARRRFDLALAAHRRLVRLAREHGFRYHGALAIWNQVRPLLRLRQAAPAARLLGYATRWWVDHYGPLKPSEHRDVERYARLGRRLIGSEAWETACAEGQALDLAQALELACGGPFDDGDAVARDAAPRAQDRRVQ